MSDSKLLTQLVAVVTELQGACVCMRQNTEAAKVNAILLKRHTTHMRGLLVKHEIETIQDLVEDNALLVERNVILMEQRETDIKSLARLQKRLEALTGNTPGGDDSPSVESLPAAAK